MVKNDGNLFVLSCDEKVSTIGVAWIIARIARRVELSPFSRGTEVRERAGAIGCCGTRDLVFRLKIIPKRVNIMILRVII